MKVEESKKIEAKPSINNQVSQSKANNKMQSVNESKLSKYQK